MSRLFCTFATYKVTKYKLTPKSRKGIVKMTKHYNKTARKYEEKLIQKGYSVKYNWIDRYSGEYEDVTVRGPIWNGYGGEFATPRKAYEYITRVFREYLSSSR